jgi:hypothetical protein
MKLTSPSFRHNSSHRLQLQVAWQRPCRASVRMRCVSNVDPDHQPPARYQATDWEQKRKSMLLQDLIQAGGKVGVGADAVREGLCTLEMLLPGVQISTDSMKASNLVIVVSGQDVLISLPTQHQVNVTG